MTSGDATADVKTIRFREAGVGGEDERETSSALYSVLRGVDASKLGSYGLTLLAEGVSSEQRDVGSLSVYHHRSGSSVVLVEDTTQRYHQVTGMAPDEAMNSVKNAAGEIKLEKIVEL